MFRIADGREHFYQWDVDRQIIVEDGSITEVHFCNRTDDCSLVVEVIDGLANVPNVILQKSFDIRVFGYDGKATRYDEAFKVKARTKPTDYVYTEIEIKRYEDLEKRIDEIEKNGISEEVITNAVENYLEKNPVDLTGYATEVYVDEKIAAIPEPDLTGYAKKSEIPDVSDFISEIPSEYVTESELTAKGYATGGYVDAKVAGIVIPSLEGYATEKYVDDAIAGIEIPEGGGDADLTNYYTKEEVDTAIYNSKDTYYLDFSNATEEAQAATADMIEFITRFNAGQNVCAHIRCPENFANAIKGWQPTTIQKVINKYIFTANAINPQQIAGDNVTPYYSFELKEDSTAGWVYYTKDKYTFAIATKDYVDVAIANINERDTYFLDTRDLVFDLGRNKNIARLPENVCGFFDRVINGNAVALQVYDETLSRFIPAEFVITADESIIVARSLSASDLDSEQTVEHWRLSYSYDYGCYTITSNLTTQRSIASQAYVDTAIQEAIAGIDIPEGGGGGSSATTCYIYGSKSSYSDEEAAALYKFTQDFKDNPTKIPEGYMFYIQQGSANAVIPYRVAIIATVLRFYFLYAGTYWYRSIYFTSDGKIDSVGSVSDPDHDFGGGDSWTYTTDAYSSELYDAKELYILCQDDDGTYCHSHIVLPENYKLGEYTYRNFCFTLPDGSDSRNRYWTYDGSFLSINFENSHELQTIAYKK